MFKYIVLCMLCLIACDGRAYLTCPDYVLGEILTEIETQEACNEYNIISELSARLMENSGLWPSYRDDVKNRVKVIVEDKDNLDCPYYGGYCSGITIPFDGVYLNKYAYSLLHEMFHVRYAWINGGGLPSNYAHAGWESNGLYALDDLFMYAYFAESGKSIKPHGGYCDPVKLLPEQRAKLESTGWANILAKQDTRYKDNINSDFCVIK